MSPCASSHVLYHARFVRRFHSIHSSLRLFVCMYTHYSGPALRDADSMCGGPPINRGRKEILRLDRYMYMYVLHLKGGRGVKPGPTKGS